MSTAERKAMHAQIDKAVEGHLSDELLGELIKQQLGLRYFTAEHTHLTQLVFDEVDKRVRQLIVEWLDEHAAEMWKGVEDRLNIEWLGPLAVQVTDEFMEDVKKGRR